MDFVSTIDNNNRVKLMADAGIPGSDYINASYVSVSWKSVAFSQICIYKSDLKEKLYIFIRTFLIFLLLPAAPLSMIPLLLLLIWVVFRGTLKVISL